MASTTVIEIETRLTDNTSSGVSSAQRNLTRLEQSLQRMQTQVSRLRSGDITVSAFLRDGASSGLRSIASLGKSLAGKVWSVTMKALDYATKPIQALINLAKNPISMVITATGVGFGVNDIISTYGGYEQSMANTKAVTGASDTEMAMIQEEVRRLGASTAYSAAEAGSTSTILGQAGWSADAIVAGMEGLMNLAAAGDVTLDTATEVTAKTISQWGMDATDSNTSAHVADVLAKTASSSYTD